MTTTPQHLGNYELQKQLGRGSAGDVWKAHDLQLRRDVAVKILHTDLQADPNFLTRFSKEGQALTSLHHSNIVQIHDVNIARPPQASETTAYIVMEYIEGQTLADYIHSTSHRGVFPSVSQIVYLFNSLGVAIDYAHQKGIIHGNIKPSNILLNKQNKAQFEAGVPMLTDFGLVQIAGSAAGVGSPLYMSPEQAKGHAPNNRSDIYSLGVMLYEICTGVQPFRDESSVAVLMQHINTLPTPPILINPNIPPALSEAILRAMAKDTPTRFATASSLAASVADACSMQSSLLLTGNKASEEDDETYPMLNSGSMPILGVAQPQRMPKAFPPVPRMPTVSRPLPAVSGPLPTTSSLSTSRPLPAQSSPTTSKSLPISPAITNKLPIPDMATRVPMQVPPQAPVSVNIPTAPTQAIQVQTAISSQRPLPIPAKRARTGMRFADAPVYIVITALLLLLLVIGSAIGASLLLNNKGQAANNNGPGQVFFQDDALGHDDLLRFDMSNIPSPPNGQNYFAWLQETNNQVQPLGPIIVRDNGSASLLYPGDAKHTNLLSITQGVIITLERVGDKPQAPTGNIIYKATVDTASFQYIKNILYTTPDFPNNQSVVAGLLDTIKSMNDKAGSIVDTLQGTHDYPLVTRQATRIIEMIDGTASAKSNGDLPANDPPLMHTSVGLLSAPTQAGYIDTLTTQLNKLKLAAGNNNTLLQHIHNVENAITDLQDWVQKIRTYDVQILKAANLADPAIISVALQLKTIAADSYTGRTMPPNQGPQPVLGSAGAYQAYVESQYMATLDIQAA